MEELKLSDREWRVFKIGQLFRITIGRSIDGNKIDKVGGKTAYITRKESNNGIDGFIDFDQNFLNKSYPCITIGNETAKPFVINFPFYTGTKVNILTPITKVNKSALSFVCTSFEIQKKNFSYSFTANSTRLNKQKIMLPIDNNGDPDWQFMADFIKQKEIKAKKEILDYYSDKALDLIIETRSLNNTEWKEFYLRDYFDFIRGNQNNMAACDEGKFPLISAKKIDNGVKDFIADNGKNNFPSNIITLNNDGDGGVGLAYYQPSETFVDTHVTALLPKKAFSKHILLFFTRAINIQRDKYSHGYSLNNARLNNQKIMLPINNNCNPDWQFMEDFMKKIEQDKIQTILSYYGHCANALFVERERESKQR